MPAETCSVREVYEVVEAVQPAARREQLPQQLSQRITLQQGFLSPADSECFFNELLHHHPWPPQDYEVYGRRFILPRQQTWHADAGIIYSWSDNLLESRPWTPLLQTLREKVQQATGERFNAVLVNLYRNGQDYVDWHTDDDKEMGDNAVIASLSLGATRAFSIRRFNTPEQQQNIMLTSGTLLVMQAGFQQVYEHAVLPDDTTQPRINLTFRYVCRQNSATRRRR
ncbi:MAG: alpha-ketoglutarate-dependent dioxygenase AlkB [Oceanospirillaceae bacterium]|nr:alpha-ketoglutarate-dependent dioxygenase AlkB [Oceanospirillaceae bacterium]MBT13898.1 alpha-ketoglutarate-dependent dioxygenase AlkB [Oceanospirillaceae bacterium]|tara:strand:+ start:19165 stop:19842 length:678 start_codon:yes stop_codon:yes gene_type:complete